jgi:hypothetical protein
MLKEINAGKPDCAMPIYVYDGYDRYATVD